MFIILRNKITRDLNLLEPVAAGKGLILDKNPGTDVILLDWETSGFFEFLKIGDSVSKNTNSLQVKIWRNKKDPIYNLEFHCFYTGHCTQAKQYEK